MAKYEFFFEGKPQSKARHRTGKHGQQYNPSEAAERAIAYFAKANGVKKINGAVRLTLVAYFPIPKSWSKKKKEAAYYHTQKPDSDNITKLYKDALNEIAWKDDSQVCDVRIQKFWRSYGEGVHVIIENLDDE